MGVFRLYPREKILAQKTSEPKTLYFRQSHKKASDLIILGSAFSLEKLSVVSVDAPGRPL